VNPAPPRKRHPVLAFFLSLWIGFAIWGLFAPDKDPVDSVPSCSSYQPSGCIDRDGFWSEK
jgi:hypothetical protein